jgi:hypothetical protein
MPIRYLVATFVACIIIGAGIVFVRQTNERMQGRFEEFRKDLVVKKEAGQLPPEWQGVDLDNLQIDQIKMRVTQDEMTRIDIARFLTAYGYFLAVLVFAACLGVAALVGKLMRPRAKTR